MDEPSKQATLSAWRYLTHERARARRGGLDRKRRQLVMPSVKARSLTGLERSATLLVKPCPNESGRGSSSRRALEQMSFDDAAVVLVGHDYIISPGTASLAAAIGGKIGLELALSALPEETAQDEKEGGERQPASLPPSPSAPGTRTRQYAKRGMATTTPTPPSCCPRRRETAQRG